MQFCGLSGTSIELNMPSLLNAYNEPLRVILAVSKNASMTRILLRYLGMLE